MSDNLGQIQGCWSFNSVVELLLGILPIRESFYLEDDDLRKPIHVQFSFTFSET